MFKKEKFNMPTGTSKGLSNFLISTRSELTGTKFNKAPKNISKGEEKALEELIELQKKKQIIIKPVDKGGGIMITNYGDYVEACQKELASKTKKAAIENQKKIFFYCAFLIFLLRPPQ